MHLTRTVGGLLAMLSMAGCFPEVPYEAAKVDVVGSGPDGIGGTDDGGGTGGTGDCSGFVDGDGDGVGTGSLQVIDCDATGYADVDGDCDDSDPLIRPGVSERCNDIDDDCDSIIDEDLSYDWYVDVDLDGYGGGDSLNDCDPPAGAVEVGGDCDDTNPDIHPDANEICNGIDDNCDLLVDDADPLLDLSTGQTWYFDGDGDGFGDPSDRDVTCLAPSEDHRTVGGDCDDTLATVNPDATEICDGEDNDCDYAIDDADGSLDTTTATAWHADLDGDGFGAAAVSATTCIGPSGHVADDQDCDDTDATINPDAAEVCNEVDDDCDGDIDDADPDVDLSTGTAFYSDADADRYGDADTEVYACVNPGGLITDSSDCNDTDATINPAGNEVCNGLDDDCDGDIDDDDSSLDISTASTWYEDADADGLGSSATTLACDQPSGYADNSDDCDDSGFDDYDGDLLQDCEDADADGDGISSDYDVDDLDDTLVRGPTGGFGTDGPLSYSGGVWSGADDTSLAADGTAGDTTISVSDASDFAVDDEVLIIDLQGTGAGVYGFHFISGISGSTLTIEPPLQDDFDSSDVVVVQRVPHFTTATVSGTLSPDAWDGSGGGLLVFRATGAVVISGSVDASGRGYLGGNGVTGHSSAGTSGGTWSGGSAAATQYGVAVDGGGGAAWAYNDISVCGGGGAYGTDGGDAQYYGGVASNSGGATYGDSALSDWFFGSGGGAGAPDSDTDGGYSDNVTGDGGNGGALIAIYSADSITVSGSVLANGESGSSAAWKSSVWWKQGEIGGGGGGAGGQVLLAADTITVSGSVTATGGGGGAWKSGITSSTGYGGAGGDGRIRLEYSAVRGSSLVSPTPSVGTYVD